jgi:hypothetical protein
MKNQKVIKKVKRNKPCARCLRLLGQVEHLKHKNEILRARFLNVDENEKLIQEILKSLSQ